MMDDDRLVYITVNDDGKSYVLNQSNHPLILGANNNMSQLYLNNDGNVVITYIRIIIFYRYT